MTTDAHDEPTEQELAVLAAVLGSTDVWDDPPGELEDAVVTAIATEAATAPATTAAPVIVSLDSRRQGRTTMWLAAAAAAVLIVGGVFISRNDPDRDGVDIALAATDTAPGASATANLTATPAGLKILLDVDGLAPAPDGSFYEAWISDGEIRVSAGTFHLHSGDDEIELWAGVADPSFDRFSITLEPLDGVAESSGNAVLTGQFDLDG